MLRADYIPSNWIFLWYVLYIFGILQYNPKLALLLGVLFNVVTLSTMVYYKAHFQNILFLASFVFFLKGIPLWTLRNTTIQSKDVYATILFLVVYVGWILLEGKTTEVYRALEGLLHNKLESHGMSMLEKMFR